MYGLNKGKIFMCEIICDESMCVVPVTLYAPYLLSS